MTISVSTVEDTMPPTMGAAMRFITPAPGLTIRLDRADFPYGVARIGCKTGAKLAAGDSVLRQRA